ncbi:hypothetical protein QBC41DRAFT_301678 [Cercophora samala]|uniref:Uncharacterized protein n=1 Tax=Cercophora samala TaxID=330535 RepID=A0AA40DDN2_9PEZI|nr:hypothetical protein QBC41DRAFT_301678 [Cercophora samala]
MLFDNQSSAPPLSFVSLEDSVVKLTLDGEHVGPIAVNTHRAANGTQDAASSNLDISGGTGSINLSSRAPGMRKEAMKRTKIKRLPRKRVHKVPKKTSRCCFLVTKVRSRRAKKIQARRKKADNRATGPSNASKEKSRREEEMLEMVSGIEEIKL